MKVLIVEDQPMIALLLKRYLTPLACEVQIAESKEQARRLLLEARDFDLVTLDLNLPDSNAQQTLADLRSLRGDNQKLVIIVISGVMNMRHAEEIFAAGADGFMSKEDVSLSSDDFLTTLREVSMAIIASPRRDQRNVAFLEKVCVKIGEQLSRPEDGAK